MNKKRFSIIQSFSSVCYSRSVYHTTSNFRLEEIYLGFGIILLSLSLWFDWFEDIERPNASYLSKT